MDARAADLGKQACLRRSVRALTPCAMSQEVSATSSFPVDANMDARAADPGKQARLRRSVRALTPGAMSQEVMYIIYIDIYIYIAVMDMVSQNISCRVGMLALRGP